MTQHCRCASGSKKNELVWVKIQSAGTKLKCVHSAIETHIYIHYVKKDSIHLKDFLSQSNRQHMHLWPKHNLFNNDHEPSVQNIPLFCASLGIGSKTCSKTVRLELKLLVKHTLWAYLNTSVLPFDTGGLLFLLHFRTHGLAAIVPLVVFSPQTYDHLPKTPRFGQASLRRDIVSATFQNKGLIRLVALTYTTFKLNLEDLTKVANKLYSISHAVLYTPWECFKQCCIVLRLMMFYSHLIWK